MTSRRPPLSRFTDLMLRHELQLRWRGGPRLMLVDRRAAAGPSPEELARVREQAELQRMREELAAALDTLPELRDEAPALAHFEQALASLGLAALDHVSLAMLRRALDEFEGLVTNWAPAGLASLRSRMAVAVRSRAQHEACVEDGRIPDSQPASRRRSPVSEPAG
jgi:hypothetical protein